MNKEVVITKETKGTFIKDLQVYKLVEKGMLKEYIPLTAPKGSTFKVINFNTSSKRVLTFLHKNNSTPEIVEVDYNDILDYTIINESSINTRIEALLISDRVKVVLSKETLNTVLIYLLITVVSFFLGKL